MRGIAAGRRPEPDPSALLLAKGLAGREGSGISSNRATPWQMAEATIAIRGNA
jgi:hypothetical protein